MLYIPCHRWPFAAPARAPRCSGEDRSHRLALEELAQWCQQVQGRGGRGEARNSSRPSPTSPSCRGSRSSSTPQGSQRDGRVSWTGPGIAPHPHPLWLGLSQGAPLSPPTDPAPSLGSQGTRREADFTVAHSGVLENETQESGPPRCPHPASPCSPPRTQESCLPPCLALTTRLLCRISEWGLGRGWPHALKLAAPP